MSSEFQVRSSLQVRLPSGPLLFQSQPTAFVADLEGTTCRGPTPGAILVTPTGVEVSLSQLTFPGLCQIANTEDSATSNAYLVYGLHDGTKFHVLGEAMPGESFVIRLFRYLGEDFTTTGTGTTGLLTTFRMASVGGNVQAFVGAFER